MRVRVLLALAHRIRLAPLPVLDPDLPAPALDRVERLRLPFQVALRVSTRQHHQLGAVLCLLALVAEHCLLLQLSGPFLT